MNKLNFKYLFPNLFLFCICMNLTACSEKNSGGDNLQSGDEIISFEPDLNTLIRNPASGWTLYDDANDYVAQANTYWNQQGAAAEKYASIFYWRSRLNPEKRNEPSCKNEVVQNLQKRSVQKSTSAQYKKAPKKTYFFGAFLLLVFWLSHQKSLTLNNKEYIIFGF